MVQHEDVQLTRIRSCPWTTSGETQILIRPPSIENHAYYMERYFWYVLYLFANEVRFFDARTFRELLT